MDSLYVQTEFYWSVSLTPAELDKQLDSRIRGKILADLEGHCIRNVGHIRTNSIEILSRQQGCYSGSHTTGNVLFKAAIRCMAAQPVKGAIITCRVTGKNTAGILASNYAMPFLMFIPTGGTEDAVEHDQVAIHDTLEVEMLDWKLQAPPVEQYWIISRITSAVSTSSVVSRLPKENLILEMIWRPDSNPELRDNFRDDLTGKWFTSLKMIREKIDTDIKHGYIKKLSLMKDAFQDFIMKSVKSMTEKRARFTENHDQQLTYRAHILGGTDSLSVKTALKVSANDILVQGSCIYVIDGLDGDLDSGLDSGRDVPPGPGLEYSVNIWSAHIRKFINDYELLRPDGDYKDQIQKFVKIPDTDRNVSRAYYKLYEMLKMREDALDGRHIFSAAGANILCMGEAPGGFINALLDLYGDRGNTITGVSITEDSRRPKVWGRLEDLILRKFPKEYAHVKINPRDDQEVPDGVKLFLIGDSIPGNHQPGDILSLENQGILAARYAGNKADFITADGGAPHDIDTESEIHHGRLIFAEILLALKCQKVGGNFILKLFDITTGLTVNMISILSHFYERVHLYKPKTSRLGSSEKYIICMYFMPRDTLDTVCRTMEKILADWNDLPGEETLTALFPNSPKMMTAMKEYNEIFMQKQTHFIRSGIDYADKYNAMNDRELESYLRNVLNAQLNGALFLN